VSNSPAKSAPGGVCGSVMSALCLHAGWAFCSLLSHSIGNSDCTQIVQCLNSNDSMF
jgi:hypothetical protein